MWINEGLRQAIRIRRVTFGEVATKWLENKRNIIKLSTYSKYDYTINKYLMPRFKKKSLSRLRSYNFNEFVAELNTTLAPKTIRDILSLLKAILYYAEDEYEVIFKKKRIIAPKLKTENLVILSKKERRRLEKTCLQENTLPSLAIILAMNTGMRIGEICALEWKNIDLEKRELHIEHTLQRIYDREHRTTRLILDTPKTQTSIRNIPISNKLYDILEPMKKQYESEAFFLTGTKENYVEPRRMQSIFRDMLKKSRVRRYKFHILRHTFASECIEVGMDPKLLSEILGHSSVDITLNRYVHSSYKMKKKFLERF